MRRRRPGENDITASERSGRCAAPASARRTVKCWSRQRRAGLFAIETSDYFLVDVEELDSSWEKTRRSSARSFHQLDLENYVKLNKKIRRNDDDRGIDRRPRRLADTMSPPWIKLEDNRRCSKSSTPRALGARARYMRSEIEILEWRAHPYRSRSRWRDQKSTTQRRCAHSEELGEKDEFKNEIRSSKRRSSRRGVAREGKGREELKKLKMMSPCREATVVRNYVD